MFCEFTVHVWSSEISSKQPTQDPEISNTSRSRTLRVTVEIASMRFESSIFVVSIYIHPLRHWHAFKAIRLSCLQFLKLNSSKPFETDIKFYQQRLENNLFQSSHSIFIAYCERILLTRFINSIAQSPSKPTSNFVNGVLKTNFSKDWPLDL